MKQEEKELLLKDLCARLPYGVKVCYRLSDKENPIIETLSGHMLDYFNENCIVEVKPYLRPMSSMTEDEYNDWCQYYQNAEMEELNKSGNYFKAAMSGDNAKYDWLNTRHFDHRGLIEKGLALEAPEGMYEIVSRSI